MIEEVPVALDGERTDRLVALVLGCSRAAASELIANGAVRVNGDAVERASLRLVEGDRLEIVDTRPAPQVALTADPSVVLDVVFEDRDVIVVDKPAGLVVHPGAGHGEGTMVHGLLARFPDIAGVGDAARPGVVHRLDRGTSGLLVVARTERARRSLVEQLSRRAVERRYWALAGGLFEVDEGVVDAPVGRSSRRRTRMAVTAAGRDARTHYSVVDRYPGDPAVSELHCRLETGRTHQIRVHLAAIGHPVLGDELYGGPDLGLTRPALHAVELGFAHPGTGEHVRFASELPDDLDAARARLRAR